MDVTAAVAHVSARGKLAVTLISLLSRICGAIDSLFILFISEELDPTVAIDDRIKCIDAIERLYALKLAMGTVGI